MPEALNSELEQAAREGLNGVRTNMVRNEWHGTEAGQQVVSKEYGPVISEAGRLSPLRIKEIEGLSQEKKGGPVLKENEGFRPIRPKEKESSSVERTQPLIPSRVLQQGVRRRIKKIAREKEKAQEVVKSEQVQEVSKKRKVYDEMLFISDKKVQKCLCAGKQKGGVNFFAETTVTANQHCLDQ